MSPPPPPHTHTQLRIIIVIRMVRGLLDSRTNAVEKYLSEYLTRHSVTPIENDLVAIDVRVTIITGVQ